MVFSRKVLVLWRLLFGKVVVGLWLMFICGLCKKLGCCGCGVGWCSVWCLRMGVLLVLRLRIIVGLICFV